MKLCFKQRFFSWFDSYDIYDAYTGATAFTVEGKLAWGHCLHILDAQGRHIATVKERVLTFLPKFDLYIGERSIGTIRKEFTLFRPGQLSGVGLHDRGRSGTHRRAHIQGAPPLDGYLHHRCAGREGRAVRAHGGACHRRRKMLARQRLKLY